MSERLPRFGAAAAWVANALILAVWAWAALLREVWSDFYTASAQEDEYVEWGTFWAFVIAAVAFVAAAVRQRRETGRIPWFLSGVSLFCLVVAMEEISWGQRVLGYRPPQYFLENNFQLELNVHNVMSTDLRKLALKGVILGYGVFLPLVALDSTIRRWLQKAAVVPPPLALAPSFLAAYLFYESYPWSLTGEWVEMMLGLGFLFAALAVVVAPDSLKLGVRARQRWGRRQLAAVAGGWLLVVAAGVANAAVSRHTRSASPETVAAARAEVEALKRDFSSGKVRSKCNRHRRLNTFVERYDQKYLLEGEFAGLVAQGLPEDRAQFFLDPWNSPYWIRDRCKSDGSRRVVFIYSFGPNRRRESGRYEIAGDDVGAVVYDGEKLRD